MKYTFDHVCLLSVTVSGPRQLSVLRQVQSRISQVLRENEVLSSQLTLTLKVCLIFSDDLSV